VALRPIGRRFQFLAPTASFSNEALYHLFSHQILVPMQIERSRKMPYEVTDSEIDWTMNPAVGNCSALYDSAIDVLLSFQRDDIFLAELAGIWRRLALAETTSFLAAELGSHQFDEEWVSSSESILDRMLVTVPVCEAFYFCWLSVRDLASAFLRQPGSRPWLDQTLARSIESKWRRAQSERWRLRAMSRHSFCEESALAFVFASIATSLGDQVLLSVPSVDVLRVYPTQRSECASGRNAESTIADNL